MSMLSLKDFVHFIPNGVPITLCDEILNRSSVSEEYKQGTVMSGETYLPIRNVSVLNISRWPDLDEQLYDSLSVVISDYSKDHPDVVFQRDEGYTLLKYEPGQYYKKHTDHGSQIPRAVSCVIGLNNEYKGGDFMMWDGEVKYHLEKGNVLLFPSNFLYPHSVEVVTEGTRYTIITWFN